MRYFGGKVRLARELSTIINKFGVQTYHEPFCGMFSVGTLVTAPRRSGSDNHLDLILLLCAVRDGWVGPATVTESEYNRLKTAASSPLRAFVGFGCSHSGKFFRGYARESSEQNFAASAMRSLVKLAPKIQGVKFQLQSYLDFNKPADLLYCDPPYANKTGFSTGDFDPVAFWQWVHERSRQSIMLVSEYTAPDWARCVWQKSVKTDMNAKGGGKHNRVEKLFLVDNR